MGPSPQSELALAAALSQTLREASLQTGGQSVLNQVLAAVVAVVTVPALVVVRQIVLLKATKMIKLVAEWGFPLAVLAVLMVVPPLVPQVGLAVELLETPQEVL